jgi:carboxylesterase
MPLVALLVLAAAGWLLRARYMRAMNDFSMRHRRLGADGVVIGGEGFVLHRDDAPAVLLLHGGGDTPQTLRYLGASLHERGFHVAAPLLPGHGRRLRDFSRVTADDLIEAARSQYAQLRADHDWVGVIGVSMGGALAVLLAAADSELPALGLVAPYLAMPARIERAARWSWLWGPMMPVVRSADGLSVLDPVERERSLAYGVFTAKGLHALHALVSRARTALPRVQTPTLMLQSRQDNRISIPDGEQAFAMLGAREKRLEWISGAAHVITVDFGREHVIEALVSWMQDHCIKRSRDRQGTRQLP